MRTDFDSRPVPIRGAMIQVAQLGVTLAFLLVPIIASAATTTLYPTSNSLIAGTATNPTNVYADDGQPANVSQNNTQFAVAGFDSTNLGTISDVTVWVKYKTSAAPTNDTYAFDAATDGSNFNQSIVAANTNNQTNYVTASRSLGAISWAQIGTLAVRCQTIKTGGNDAYTVDWDVAYIVVTYTPAAATTTVGNGTDPGNASPCPGDAATMLDAFTLQTSSGTDTVTSVTVSLASGTAAGLSLIEITNDAGGTVYGSVSNPATDTPNITLSSNISATTTLIQYKVRITPKSHVNMPAPPGSTYSVTGTVTAITSTNTKSYNDTASATITIDNTSPTNPTWGTITPGNTQVALNWTNPGGDFSQVVILRSTATISDKPSEGATYAQGNTIGSSTVRYVGSLQTFTDTGLNNGTPYYYKIFAKDTCGNYSTGSETGPHTPNAATTTVGNGTNPGSASICPGDGATMLDAFTLQTSTGTDSVTAVTVSLAAGTAAGLSLVEITDDAGGTVYGSVSNPATDTPNITLSSSITATTTLTQYKVRITPKSHANMPAPPGSTYSVTGTVTAVTSTNTKTYNDTASSTVTIDNISPTNPTWGTITPGNSQVQLNWTNPGGDFSQVVILRSTATISDTPSEGATYSQGNPIGASTVRYVGTLQTFLDTGLTNGTPYYYKIFAKDTCGNYSTGSQTGAHTPTAGNTAPSVSITSPANASSWTQGASVTFTGTATDAQDGNLTASLLWTSSLDGAIGTGGSFSRSDLSLGTHTITASVTDSGSLNGQAQVTITITAAAIAGTTAGTVTTVISSCRQLTVTAPFTGDDDLDGSIKVEYNTTNSWPGTTACAAVSGVSPRQCLVTGLSPSTQYWTRTTFNDPDGVSGANPQVTGVHTLPACTGDQEAPTVTVLAPARGATVGGTEVLKFSVHDGDAISSAQVKVGTAAFANASVSVTYACGAGCTIYEFSFDTSAQPNGSLDIAIRVTDVTANIAETAWGVIVRNTVSGQPAGGGTLLRRTHGSQLCLDCHALATHSSAQTSRKYGNWSIDCLTCHTPHKTRNIYLVREMLQTVNSGMKTIVFQQDDRTGGTNPNLSYLGDHPATYDDGICEACHTKTSHYRNSTSGGDHTHNQNTRCVDCHSHTAGFAGAGCNGCHDAPPTVGKHRNKHDEIWDSTSGNTASSYDDATSHATSTQYGFACAKCHSGSHINDATGDGSNGSPWAVEVTFQGRNVQAPFNGSYSGTYNANQDQGPSGEWWSWSNGTCTNLYCHSNAEPRGGATATASVSWNSGATTCSSCHQTGARGDGGNGNTFLSLSHAKHIKSTAGEASTYAFKCDECHSATIVNDPNDPWNLVSADLGDKTKHVDEVKDVAFSSTFLATTINQSGASYNTSTLKCSNSYCHSSATSTSAPFPAPNNPDLVWGTSNSSCRSCHSGNATTTPTMATNKHANHVNNAALIGVNLQCADCHNATVSLGADETITNFANHVNGVKNVSGTNAGTWNGTNCQTSGCHSSGQRSVTPQYYTVTWATDSLTCNGCHGRYTPQAFAAVAGEPNYANGGAGTTTANSHQKHVTAATDCASCHRATVATSNAIDGTQASSGIHLDLNGTPDVVLASAFDTNANFSYTASTKTCAGSDCHGDNSIQWGGGPLSCRSCHVGTGVGDQDVDDWVYNNGAMAKVDGEDWATYGHGATSFAESGNPTANFDNGGARDGCLYCHASGVNHGLAGNPFRLANIGAGSTTAEKNGVCTVCHGGSGYNPGSGLVDSTVNNVNATHYGGDHSSTGDGGMFCWDCHDPHGDYNYAASQRLAFMIDENPTRDHAGATGWGIPTATAPTPDFRNNRDGSNGWAWGDYVSNSLVSGTYRGMCQVCHTNTSVLHFRQTTYDATHNSGTICTSCHDHIQPPTDAFKPQGGGDCRGCHGGSTQGSTPPRRAVDADFGRQSHHVGNGGTMGGALTNFDCIVCHAEGYVDTTPNPDETNTNANYHANGVIDLRNVDLMTMTNSGTGNVFTYDKDAIGATPNPATWNSANATWSAQMQNSVDPFCLTCHDNNGANAANVAAWDSPSGTATNPFGDGTVTNNYDQVNRGGVVDIKSRVTAGAGDLEGAAEPRTPDGRPDPPQGIYSRHAIRGQSVSVYGGTDPALDNTTYWNRSRVNWASNSVMACADCHTTDGANTTTGNAHGSDSEYLLKDASGTATEGTLAGNSYNCYLCHNASAYNDTASHTGNGSDYTDYTGATGAARVPQGNTGGNIYAMACTNCHGGGYETKGDTTAQFGTIHGTSQIMAVGQDGGAGSRQAYRFTNGNSMRFYDPGTWTGAGTCYTLSAKDTFGGCTKHAKGTGGLDNLAGRRPLKY